MQDLNMNPQFVAEGGLQAFDHLAVGVATEENIAGGAVMLHAVRNEVAD